MKKTATWIVVAILFFCYSGGQGSSSELGSDTMATLGKGAVITMTSSDWAGTPAVGACCTGSGCSVELQSDCEALSGIYLGDDTVCSGADCNGNGVPDQCDIASGTSEDCNGNGKPDECDLAAGAGTRVAITEVDLGGADGLEIQNVSGAAVDTTGWIVAISESPYSDPSTVNPIIQSLPATMAADEIIYWTDLELDNYWGSNMFWNPGDYPTFSGWAIILDDAGAIVDFATWNGMPEAEVAGLVLNIGPHAVTIGGEWIGDAIDTPDDPSCGLGFSVQRVGDTDHNDALDWLCQASNLGMQHPGLVVPLGGGSSDCNGNGVPDECDIQGNYTSFYSQAVIPDDNGVGPGLLLAIGSSYPFGNASADDFALASSADIVRITWEGFYFGTFSDFPGVDNDFHVTFYEDNGSGNVGAVIADFPSVSVTKSRSSRPPAFGTNPVYRYATVLPSPVSVNGGQRYWLSINGDSDGVSGPVFGWMASNEGNAASIAGNDQPLQNVSITNDALPALNYTPGGEQCDQDADLAFALYSGTSAGSGDCNSNGIPDECDIADGSSADYNSNGIPDECEATSVSVGLDIKPGSCPNSLNPKSKGYLPVGLLGTKGFDVTRVDPSSVRLRRTDGIGGEVAPHEGPPGPHTVIADVGTPFDGLDCECTELKGDGVADLNMKFRVPYIVTVLELDTLPAGAEVELFISGKFVGGTSFESPTDCIRIARAP